jgi:hypothetical protein
MFWRNWRLSLILCAFDFHEFICEVERGVRYISFDGKFVCLRCNQRDIA